MYEMWLASHDVEPERASCKAFRGKLNFPGKLVDIVAPSARDHGPSL